jgi:mono/diheme cytochrome c family protein
MRGFIIPAGLVLGIFVACASGRRGEPVAAPVVVDEPLLVRGRQVFLRNCEQCHPGGDAGLGPALSNKPVPKGLLATQVRVGIGAMPGFSDALIADDELDALVQYVERLRKSPPPSSSRTAKAP